MDKLSGKSKDIIEQNIEQLKAIFPEVFTEGKIQFDQLEELLTNHITKQEENYNFTWHGKREAGSIARTSTTGTLRPCTEESVNWNTTQNLFIEGDNLEVLKLLQASYYNQVKMIYIDPPYNTGNDFVYEDDFKDGVKHYLKMTGQLDSEGKKLGTNTSSAGRFHTNWLNMMYPRLLLAKKLLKEDGVIFISIDDNEQANLKKMCDEIFGERNFVGQMVWLKKNAQNDAQEMQKNHEYILCFKKDQQALAEVTELQEVKVFKDNEKFYYETSGFVMGGGKGGTLSGRPNLGFTIYYNPTTKDFLGFDDVNKILAKNSNNESEVYTNNQELLSKGYVPIRPNKNGNSLGRWKWSIEKFNTEKHKILIKETKKGYTVVRREFIEEKEVKKYDNGELYAIKETTFNAKSVVDKIASGTGTKELKSLFSETKIFDNPKSIKLIKHLLQISTAPNDLILDFFAGSGTTAQAVMELNQEEVDKKAQDGLLADTTAEAGGRKFILVQLPEPTKKESEAFKAGYTTIAEISKERIRRAAKKIQEENPNYKGDLGFKVFKLDSSNLKLWDPNFDTLNEALVEAVNPIKPDRSKEDMLYEIVLKMGLSLTTTIKTRTLAGATVYCIGGGALVVCLDKDISLEVVKGIGELKEELQPEIIQVVFKDDSFTDDVFKTNALLTLKRYGIETIKTW